MRLSVLDTERCVGCQSCMFACTRRFGDAGFTRSCIGVRSVGGMERGFVVVVCRACENPPCAKVCPTDALKLRKKGGVYLDIGKCIGCGNCMEACIVNAIFWDDEDNRPMICTHCGYCARFCPHKVIGLQENEEIQNE